MLVEVTTKGWCEKNDSTLYRCTFECNLALRLATIMGMFLVFATHLKEKKERTKTELIATIALSAQRGYK